MHTVKKILSAIVMVIAVLGLVISLAGVGGVWYVRAQITAPLVGIFTTAEARVASAQEQLDQLDATLVQARDQVAAVEEQVKNLGTDLETNTPLVDAIAQKLNIDLAPLAQRAQELMATIRETSAAINTIVQTINALPFISNDIPELELLDKLIQDIESFQAEVKNLIATVDQRRTELIQGTAAIITTPTSKIVSALDEKHATLSGFSQQLTTVQEQLAALASTVEKALLWMAIILTLFLLWLAFSQLAVVVLAWRWFTGREILARKQQPAPVEVAAGAL